MSRTFTVEDFDQLYHESLKLLALYKKHNLTLPFTLKGNLGEFFFAKKCLEKYRENSINYIGGAFPGIDLKIDKVRIQIKTQIKHDSWRFKSGLVEYEACPTVRKSVIEEQKCDVIILVILHPNEAFSDIANAYFYSFTKSDFHLFTSHFVISGKKGDLSIYHILKVEGKLPKGKRAGIEHYNQINYKELFRSSLNNWNKIDALLQK